MSPATAGNADTEPIALGALLTRAAERWPDRVAVAQADRTLTYRELEDEARSFAMGLAAFGLEPGEKALLQIPNSPEFLIALFGALTAGVVPVMCLPGHRDAELAHFTRVCGAVAHLTTRHMAKLVSPPVRALTTDVVLAAGRAYAKNVSEPVLDPDSPALLLVSGGTTGLPKLIPRTHRDYLYNLSAAARVCELSESDVYLAALPVAHNFPLACPGALGAMSLGSAVVFAADPSPEAAFAAIERHRVTVTALTPPLAGLWASAAEWEPADLGSLRLLQVGGAKLEAERAKEILPALGLDRASNAGRMGLQQVFGMAEGLVCFTRPDDPDELVFESQGRPMSDQDEVRLMDESGAEVPDGEVGELETRGPYTIAGYYNAPEANARAFAPDGFYRSGDLARRLPSGHLVVVGRAKDVINRGGETISAEEVEEHLHAHPEIDLAAAVPCPDEFLGEKICAAVVLRTGACESGPLDLPRLRAFLAARGLSAEKQPDMLLQLPTLPMTPVGKVDKRAIAAQLR
ncbi:(2,3-dihydroxybenzoyl)adenylate synthase [Segniliparus rugosus]|uniref:(2,3-dihydroxybenzoyl)adenylate synthase n=1 Tax=Segniliparus rugosus (strain ATCC BAA-974 / DSM 45345 / CCUG 50838 / CIP 108380 / JCM 13579 / CDC 945) TaxID=679197 RepID=E5XLS1_SEGRC|nr:AMP-binding protein [Segniliparus rugosus]EFV14749.1 (2,3-dihydroxybenzoyl)adenylate synthase [Segniliparus rugosus ATCC BAA-974]